MYCSTTYKCTSTKSYLTEEMWVKHAEKKKFKKKLYLVATCEYYERILFEELLNF